MNARMQEHLQRGPAELVITGLQVECPVEFIVNVKMKGLIHEQIILRSRLTVISRRKVA